MSFKYWVVKTLFENFTVVYQDPSTRCITLHFAVLLMIYHHFILLKWYYLRIKEQQVKQSVWKEELKRQTCIASAIAWFWGLLFPSTITIKVVISVTWEILSTFISLAFRLSAALTIVSIERKSAVRINLVKNSSIETKQRHVKHCSEFMYSFESGHLKYRR